MKASIVLSAVFCLLQQVNAANCTMSNAQALQQDANVLNFAMGAQTLLVNFYASMSNISAMNFSSMPYPYSTVQDLTGLQTQARLGQAAVSQVQSLLPAMYQMNMSMNATGSCMYNFSSPANSSELLTSAFTIEAAMCATFIGLADYVVSPTNAFVMARLAAEHGIHAASIRALYDYMPVFMGNSTSLTPAMTPTEAMMALGPMMGTCGSMMTAPQLPCSSTLMNSTLAIGPLIAKAGGGMLDIMTS